MQIALMTSETIMSMRRLYRSAHTPAKGPSTAWGTSPAIPATPKAEMLPVVSVIHHIRTNCVSDDPIRESA